MPEVIVPPFPGVTSAIGLALRRSARRLLVGLRAPSGRGRPGGDRERSTTRWRSGSSASLDPPGRRARARSPSSAAIDLRYIGQLHSVTVPIDDLTERRVRRRGRSLPRRAPAPVPLLPSREPGRDLDAAGGGARRCARSRDLARCGTRSTSRAALPERERQVHFDGHGWVAHARPRPERARSRTTSSPGPCMVEELDSTVVLPPGTSARVDAVGNIVIALGRALDERDRDRPAGADRPDHLRGAPQRLHERRRRDGADARARRPLARRQRGPRLQRRDLRRRRAHGRRGQGGPARPRRDAAAHGEGRHLVGRQGTDPRGRHLHHERRLHRRHALPGRAHDHAGLPRRRARRVRPELGALVGRRRPRARELPRRGRLDVRRGALHPAHPPRPRRASSTTRCCASSCATSAFRRRPRATSSRRSPPAGRARRACRR